MAIVGALPSTIKNGDAVDATVVMSLFSYIQSQVNNNACPSTAGTSILKGNGSGGTQAAAAGTDFLAPAPGMVFDFAGPTANIPSGYLACDGSAVSRSTYSALFSAIGTTWGAGDGSTTFNVPDLRRRTTIGAGGTSVSGPAATIGSVGGEEAHVLTVTELAAHNHGVTVTDPGHAHGITDPTHFHAFGAASNIANGGASPSAFNAGTTGATQSSSTGITINSATTGITASSANTGGGASHNNMQPSAVVNKIIKV